jgi:hypothetical protein
VRRLLVTLAALASSCTAGEAATLCDLVPGCYLDSEEERCGWQRTDKLHSPRADIVSDDGLSFVAPAGECLLVEVRGDDRLVPVGTDPCEVEGVGRMCAVLAPGGSVTVFGKVGVTPQRGSIDWAPASACPFACAGPD